MSKIIGVTVGTPTSPAKMEKELKPVKTVNGRAPDENGNVEVEGVASSTDTVTSISVTEAADGTVTIVNTLSSGNPETIVITPDENGNPGSLTYNGTAIPIEWVVSE